MIATGQWFFVKGTMMANMTKRCVCAAISLVAALGTGLVVPPAAFAQIEITEILFDSKDTEPTWEWMEIRNTSGSTVDLNGWVFGDRASRYNFANIDAGAPVTEVPAGGMAVIYNSTSSNGLNGQPTRFTDAWGSGIQLIPVNIWPALNNGGAGDRIGLWSSYANYNPGGGTPTAEPVWANAVDELDYATAMGYPSSPSNSGRSIAWKGSGSATDPSQWSASLDGELGAHLSLPTTVNGQVNSTDDAGTPGLVLQGGTPPAGKLVISEIMYNPRSSLPGNVETGFEWVEFLNNTGSTVDFGATNYVLDDLAGTALTSANITSGSVANGGIAVLFSSELLTVEQMEAAWEPGVGTTVNFIPVSNWQALNNSDESIALWDVSAGLANYAADKATLDPAMWTHAAAAVTYSNDPMAGWPDDDGNGSIYLNDLGADPNAAANWTLTGGGNDPIGAANPEAIIITSADHDGDDVGSPGFVPSAADRLARRLQRQRQGRRRRLQPVAQQSGDWVRPRE